MPRGIKKNQFQHVFEAPKIPMYSKPKHFTPPPSPRYECICRVTIKREGREVGHSQFDDWGGQHDSREVINGIDETLLLTKESGQLIEDECEYLSGVTFTFDIHKVGIAESLTSIQFLKRIYEILY
jgi:hypothetical protein